MKPKKSQKPNEEPKEEIGRIKRLSDGTFVDILPNTDIKNKKISNIH
jgi:hypothetical protein